MTNSFRIVGGGPQKVIVLHRWFCDHGIGSPVFALLDGARFTYAFMDDRGDGASSCIEGQYTIEEVAQDALGVADLLGWARFSAVGHSMAAWQRSAWHLMRRGRGSCGGRDAGACEWREIATRASKALRCSGRPGPGSAGGY